MSVMGAPKISEYQKSCLNCGWFDFNPERKHVLRNGEVSYGNRMCMYSGKIRIKNGVCQCWKDCRTPEQIANGELIMKGFC